MNECEAKKDTNKCTGQIMIETEERNADVRTFNITLLRILRSFLINSPPILTKDLELGNLRRNNHNDFVYSDFDNYMGKFRIQYDIV